MLERFKFKRLVNAILITQVVILSTTNEIVRQRKYIIIFKQERMQLECIS